MRLNELCAAARRGKLQDVRDLLDRGVPVDAGFASTSATPLVYGQLGER